MTEVMNTKPNLQPKATFKYMVKIIKRLLLWRQMSSIGFLLQIAGQYNLLIHHMDVKSAYLNVPFDYKIFRDPPKGFEDKWELFGNLKKFLYGLKQQSNLE